MLKNAANQTVDSSHWLSYIYICFHLCVTVNVNGWIIMFVCVFLLSGIMHLWWECVHLCMCGFSRHWAKFRWRATHTQIKYVYFYIFSMEVINSLITNSGGVRWGNSYMSETHWGWVNDGRFFIFGWTIHLRKGVLLLFLWVRPRLSSWQNMVNFFPRFFSASMCVQAEMLTVRLEGECIAPQACPVS